MINGLVVNNTFCNIHFCTGELRTFLPLVTRNSYAGQVAPQLESDIVESPAGIERAVANGMLMVIVEPEEFSTAFTPGDVVTTTQTVDVRLGPGANYASFSTIPAATPGIILEQLNGLNGVLAKAEYWWYVNFGGVLGWVPDGALAKQGSEIGE
ncbi:MAG: hypothetical protein A2136_03225 [Chloroflexi bacterium RBG_16_54_11]|nr:MAG: hypothetical protein A2136_03225 [Chloroflexi bacterium RBG_16_54_11]